MYINHLFPCFLRGRVVTGFGRGGKELNCPTANIEDSVVEKLPSELPCGVFYGLARIDGGEVTKMVSSIGWNPHYQNKKKTLEVHMLKEYEQDFYGSMMDILLLGFIRSMTAFSNAEELKAAINSDISTARKELERIDISSLIHHFFI